MVDIPPTAKCPQHRPISDETWKWECVEQLIGSYGFEDRIALMKIMEQNKRRAKKTARKKR